MHVDKKSLPVETLVQGYETRLVEWGEYTAYFERTASGTDWRDLYEWCECPHFGYVFRGKLRFVHRDGSEEVISAGEMYYVPPGHTFQVLEAAETVEFSPTAEYERHMEKVARNLAVRGSSGRR